MFVLPPLKALLTHTRCTKEMLLRVFLFFFSPLGVAFVPPVGSFVQQPRESPRARTARVRGTRPLAFGWKCARCLQAAWQATSYVTCNSPSYAWQWQPGRWSYSFVHAAPLLRSINPRPPSEPHAPTLEGPRRHAETL